MPGVADWQQMHRPYLERARALIVVCTPGAKLNEGPDDWVHREIDWWLEHRDTAPILIDPLMEGERYVPEAVARRWPNIQRVPLVEKEWLDLSDSALLAKSAQIRRLVLGAILPSGASVYAQELDTERRRARRLRLALAVSFFMLLATVWFGFNATLERESAETARARAQEERNRAEEQRAVAEDAREEAERRLALIRRFVDVLGMAQDEDGPFRSLYDHLDFQSVSIGDDGVIRTNLTVDRVNAADLLRSLTLDDRLKWSQLQEDEKDFFVTGTIPLRFSVDGYAVDGAEIQAVGPGSLKFLMSDALKYGGPDLSILTEALANFEYESLEITIWKELEVEEPEIQIRLRGRNPDVLDGHPIVLNVNVGGLLEALLQQ